MKLILSLSYFSVKARKAKVSLALTALSKLPVLSDVHTLEKDDMAHCNPCVKDNHTTVTSHTTSCMKPHPCSVSSIKQTTNKNRGHKRTQNFCCTLSSRASLAEIPQYLSSTLDSLQDSRHLTAVCHSALQVRDLCSLPIESL